MTDLYTHLKTRRTVPSAKLTAPAPNEDQLADLLEIASRVPDHGKLARWRFIIVAGEARGALGARIGALYASANPDAPDEKRLKESHPFEPSPLVIAVVSTAADHPKIPVWEQELTAGAVCLNLMHAAYALGFSAQWLTGFAATDHGAMTVLGLSGEERIAGFIHIGTASEPPVERARPDVPSLTTTVAADGSLPHNTQ
ncbi:MAG: nitroreductase [Pseudomonadota bacterium]